METKYDYYKNVKNDVIDYVDELLSKYGERVTYDNKDSLYDRLYDDLFDSDRVTGNGSGSYTFSAWQAEDNLCHNMDLYYEAVKSFGNVMDGEYNPERMDIIIRCYLFPECLNEYLNEIVEEE